MLLHVYIEVGIAAADFDFIKSLYARKDLRIWLSLYSSDASQLRENYYLHCPYMTRTVKVLLIILKF